jgi:hypothetical protein
MLDDFAQAFALLSGGFLVGTVAIRFFKTLFGSEKVQSKLAEYRKMREDAQRELDSRTDISDSDRAQTEVSITRTYARQLDELDEQVARTNKILLLLAGTGGTAGIILLLYRYFDRIRDLLTHFGAVELFLSPALAAEGGKSELSPLIPYIAMAILGLMGLSFIVALGTILTVKDTKENQAKIKAADNIVKTFGGFFTGLATTLLH